MLREILATLPLTMLLTVEPCETQTVVSDLSLYYQMHRGDFRRAVGDHAWGLGLGLFGSEDTVTYYGLRLSYVSFRQTDVVPGQVEFTRGRGGDCFTLLLGFKLMPFRETVRPYLELLGGGSRISQSRDIVAVAGEYEGESRALESKGWWCWSYGGGIGMLVKVSHEVTLDLRLLQIFFSPLDLITGGFVGFQDVDETDPIYSTSRVTPRFLSFQIGVAAD
jgi:hypothetical protein